MTNNNKQLIESVIHLGTMLKQTIASYYENIKLRNLSIQPSYSSAIKGLDEVILYLVCVAIIASIHYVVISKRLQRHNEC